MTLEYIKRFIRSGLFQEARRLIEREDNIHSLMFSSNTDDDLSNDSLPLLVMLSLVKDEENAVNLSRLLLEKGYHIDLSDRNGLCALNYAIALQRIKLLSLFLDSFEFELDTYRDYYKNTFLHYVFATNNDDIIEKFSQVYSKYYLWDIENFKNIRNCDGLSVKDLYDYSEFLKTRHVTFKNSLLNRPKTSYSLPHSNYIYAIPDYFKFESNPIIISKYINQVFSSNSTMKFELAFVKNTTYNINFKNDKTLNMKSGLSMNQKKTQSIQNNKEFKINILYQIRSINKSTKIKSYPKLLNGSLNGSLNDLSNNDFKTVKRNFSPINNTEHMPRIFNSNNLFRDNFGNSQILKINSNNSNWRSDLRDIFSDYSIINSSSYRTSSASSLRPNNCDLQNLETSNADINEKSRASSACSQKNNQLSNNNRKLKSPSHSGKLDNYLVPSSLLIKPKK